MHMLDRDDMNEIEKMMEQIDVSQQFPEKVAELNKILISQHIEPENIKFRIGLLGDHINP